jgi:putative endonuclease
MERRTSTAGQRAGDQAEDLVTASLIANGWTVLARNVRLGRSELDLVAVDPGPPAALVVIEVRWRSRRDFGLPEETLSPRKRVALRRAVGALLDKGALPDGTPLPRLPVRVDLVAVDLDPRGRRSVRHHRSFRP